MLQTEQIRRCQELQKVWKNAAMRNLPNAFYTIFIENTVAY